jgi:antitoxin component of MazEF toxin-antitoxin module
MAGTVLTRLVPHRDRISTKNQISIPVAALDEVGLHAGERVTVEPAGDGELRIRRTTTTFEDAFGTLTAPTLPAISRSSTPKMNCGEAAPRRGRPDRGA